jgi:peptidoglycan/LPS O-acetylase OafA/YrhL
MGLSAQAWPGLVTAGLLGTKATQGSHKRLPCLDGLRAVSILLVILGHLQVSFPGAPAYLLWFCHHAQLGVVTFFVLSGYLITYLLKRESMRTGGISLRSFYARRAFRILPAFYMYLACVGVLTLLGWLHVPGYQWLSAGTFTWNYKQVWESPPVKGDWSLGHFWSLCLEEQFYLVWPLCLVMAGVFRAERVVIGAICALPIVRVLSHFLVPAWRDYVDVMFQTATDPLMFGCLLALWEGKPVVERGFQCLRHPVFPLLAAVFVLLISPWLSRQFLGMYELPVARTLEAASLAFIVGWLLRNASSRMGRCLNWPWVVEVGVLSYSLYLWQQLFITPENWSSLTRFPNNVLCAVAAALACHWLIERPALRLGSRFRRV